MCKSCGLIENGHSHIELILYYFHEWNEAISHGTGEMVQIVKAAWVDIDITYTLMGPAEYAFKSPYYSF